MTSAAVAPPRDAPTRRPRWSVAAVVGTYLVVGLAWIVASTPLVRGLSEALGVPPITIELFKGIGFVVVTGTVLYASMRHWETAFREATDRGQQDLELRERRFRNLAEHTQGAVYRFLLPGQELDYMSPQFTAITGYGPQDLRDDPGLLLSRIHPDDRGLLELRGDRGPADGSNKAAVTTFRFQRADGEWIWIEDHHTPEFGSDGHVEAEQGIAFDVTARRAEEQARTAALEHERTASKHLRRAVQAHEVFLSGISHELRTPLTGVVGFAQTLQARDASMSADERGALLERLTANATRLGRLLDDMLDLDRLNRGVLEVHLQDDVDLAQVATVIADELDCPQHRLLLDVPHTAVRLDRPKVERIIDNLLRNAIKHTPPSSTVRLHVEERGPEVLITVEDDGPGIDEDAEALFEAFRQGTRAVTAPNPGTGIGLALVREFAEIHGGRAWYEPREPHGARFMVRLPAG